MKCLKNMQKRATRPVEQILGKSCGERLEYLGLLTLEQRRIRGEHD
jgi:hypothetical protein